MTKRKSFIIAVAVLLLLGGKAHTQTLDDAIDAELDEVSEGSSPSTAPKSSKSVDDIQLDDDGASAPAPQTAKAPEPPPAPPAPAPAEQPAAPTEPAAASTQTAPPAANDAGGQTAPPAATDAGGGPSPGVVEDELKLDDTPAGTTTEATKPSDVPDVDLDTDSPKTEEAKTPMDEGGDLNVDSGTPENPAPNEPAAKPQAPAPPAPAPRVAEVTMDNGNAAYEKRLSKIANGYRQVPDINWDEIVGDRHQEQYQLMRGDTLWDISETFFGDGFFWAKLWSQNGVIGNPHRILKGKAIRFVAGTESDAPAVGVMDVRQNSEIVSTNPFQEPELDRPTYREQVQSEVTPEEIESGVVLETDELIPAPELPPPNKRAPLLKNLPRSFAETHISVDADYDATGLQTPPHIKADEPASIFVNSMILDSKPDEIGKIDEIESQERVASAGQNVFVRANRELSIGQRVTFVRPRPKPAGGGPIVDVLGVGVVDGTVKENSNTYHVQVTTSLFPVEKGSLVLDTPPARVTVSSAGKRSEAKVAVLGGEFDDKRKYLGAGSIVYLGGGSNVGFHAGDIVGVSARRGSRRADTKYPEFHHPIAELKIADVREHVATAIVVSSTAPIQVGDLTSGEVPEDLPSLRAETADEAADGFGKKEDAEAK